MTNVTDLDTQIVLVDDNGNEELADILFTLDNEDEHFVFITKPQHDDEILEGGVVEVYRYEELEDGSIGNIFEIPEDDTKTWDLVQEVFLTFEENGFEVE